jgi:TP901 family phage tail tape measure protein
MDRVVKIVLRGEVTDAIAKIKNVGAATSDLGKRMSASNKEADAWRRGLSAVGDSAGRLGLAAGVGMGLAVRAFANFDEAMSHVAATGSDAKQSIEGLREAALEAGSRTAYSATEAAQAIEELAKAGVSAKDILGGALDGALDLAAAGGLGVADAASIAATTLNQFSLDGTKASHVADLLSGAANAAQGSVADVGQALKYVGPVASQMGVSLEETTGTIAELASQGILADGAGTALRGMLSSLTSPSKVAADTMSELGVNVYNAQGEFVGFKGIAGELKDSMSGLGNAERDQALGRIFGNEQITAARILYAGGAEDVAKWTKAVDQDGSAAATAGERMNNLKGDIEQLTGALETAFIGTASSADGPLRDLTQQLTGLVNQYNKLPEPLKSATFGLAAVTAALGVGLFATSRAVTGFVQMQTALKNLGTTAPMAATALKAVGVAGLAFAAIDFGATIGDSFDKRSSADIDKMADSLDNLVKTGKATGDLKDLFGEDLGGKTVKFGKDLGSIGEAIDSLQGHANDSSLTELRKFMTSGGQSAGVVAQAEALQDLDKAFASLSESDPEGAIAAFQKIRDTALDSGAEVNDIAKAFPTMTQALQAAASSTGRASDATSVLTSDLKDLTPAAVQATEEQTKLDDANRKTANAFLDISQGIDDSKVSLDAWITQMADQAKALNDFADNAVKAGKRGLEDGLIASLQEAGPAGAMRLKQLADASDSELGRANRAWRKSQRAAEDYIEQFGQVPGSVVTNIRTPGMTNAIGAAGSLRAALANIPKLTETTIRTIRDTYDVPKGSKSDRKPSLALPPPTAQAAGGPVNTFPDRSSDTIPRHLKEIA